MTNISLTYIGIGIAPYACSVITTIASKEKRGEYAVARVWNKNFMTYKGIIQEVSDALKIKQISNETIEKDLSQYNAQEMLRIKRDMRLNHHYSIVSNPDSKLTVDIETIDVKYTNLYQNLSFDHSESLCNIKDSILLTSGLINDELVSCGNDLDITAIKSEINNLKEPEDFNNLSPQLTALSLSLGEAEFRRINKLDDVPGDAAERMNAISRAVILMCNQAQTGFQLF
jgi:hypothetical protein